MTKSPDPSLRQLAQGLDDEVNRQSKRRVSPALEALKKVREQSRKEDGPPMVARVTENSRTPFLLSEYNGFVHHILYMANSRTYRVFRWKRGARQSSREAMSGRTPREVIDFITGLADLKEKN